MALKNKLQQLQEKSIIVADSGDIDEIKNYKPQDATTNPSLILKTIKNPHYKEYLHSVITQIAKLPLNKDQKATMGCDHLAVVLGAEILRNINGYVSTEVDARLSFDIEKTVNRAKQIISYYETLKIPKDRILIKIAATWEGIKAAEILKMQGIRCNMTLVFHLTQAIAIANSEIYLISPFVGRILDWYNKNQPAAYNKTNDPGVISVKSIYGYYKQNDVKTILMAASFRNIGEIEALSGCDRLTIAPNLLKELADDTSSITDNIFDNLNEQFIPAKTNITKEMYRWQMNESAMATEKLAEGIRKFAADQIELESIIAKELDGIK